MSTDNFLNTPSTSYNTNSLSSFLSSLSSSDEAEKVVDENVFYFETDYLALKGNPDYLKLLRALSILEVQRIKVCNDIDQLEKMKIKAKEDPISVYKEIISGDSPYGGRCNIEKVPDIDWAKYKNINFDGKMCGLMTRRKTNLDETDMYEIKESSDPDKNTITVRGRPYNENKPETFNQLWTVEEQLRLEALLVEFPPEPVESRRWKKIADALGNRTTKQVCSRVQKYFRKLRKAGIAVPGKPPRVAGVKPRLIHRKNKHLLYRPTTFFPGVAMKELESEDSEDGNPSSEPDLSHWIDILAKIKEEKKKDQTDNINHFGYKCATCHEEPIKGLRWECKSCPSVSFCCDCLAGLLEAESPIHPVAHQFSPVYIYTNPLYNPNAFKTSNYLDPNFVS